MADRPPLDLRANTLLSTRETRAGANLPIPARRQARSPRKASASRRSMAAGGIRMCRPNRPSRRAGSRCRMRVRRSSPTSPALRRTCRCSTIARAGVARRWPWRRRCKTPAASSPMTRTRCAWRRFSTGCAGPASPMSRWWRSRIELEPLAGRMDLVLVDAPCTGSGTWRRRPDAKWRLSQKQLEVRQREQCGDPGRGQPLRQAGRPPRLHHLLGVRGRKWRSDRRFPRAFPGLRAGRSSVVVG